MGWSCCGGVLRGLKARTLRGEFFGKDEDGMKLQDLDIIVTAPPAPGWGGRYWILVKVTTDASKPSG